MNPAERTRDEAPPLVGFKQHFRAQVVKGEAVYLLSQSGVRALRGSHIERLAPLLDGSRTIRALLHDARTFESPAVTGKLLRRLAEAGLISYRHPIHQRHARAADWAYWDAAGVDSNLAVAAINDTPVQVHSIGGANTGSLIAACRESGLNATDESAQVSARFSLVVCDDYLSPELREISAHHHSVGRTWLLAKPGGAESWVGPIFRPGSGPCWSCLEVRLQAHRNIETPLRRAVGRYGSIRPPEASLAAGRAIGQHMTVLEVAKWIAGVRNRGQSSICTVDSLTLKTSHHPVIQRPQCPDCGDPGLFARRTRQSPRLIPGQKIIDVGGGRRTRHPADMLSQHRNLVDPLTGIIRSLDRDPHAPDGIHSYVSGRNLALRNHSLAGARQSLRSHSGGKGVTALEAKVSALCEAAERFSATRQGDEPAVVDTLAALGDTAIHPNDWQLFHQRQFDDRERWNASHGPLHQVCAPFDEQRPIEWTPIWSFPAGTERLLPTCSLYFTPQDDYAPAHLPWADSNGNAAGTSLEDAAVQGILELVERDAVALWWYNRTRQPAVDLDSFDEPWLSELRDVYGRIAREVWALDLTSDLGIPVIAVLSRLSAPRAPDAIAFGFGAHFDPRTALRRAFTEMGQMLPPIRDLGSDARGQHGTDPETVNWWHTATILNHPYLMPDPAESPLTPCAVDYAPRNSLLDDIQFCCSQLNARGMQLFLLDQTRPDVEIPVVKAIVPGMRHFWARFAPGRLFDVPVELGRLSRHTSYESLNPVPMFL